TLFRSAEPDPGEAPHHAPELLDLLRSLGGGGVASLGRSVVERVVAPVERVEAVQVRGNQLLLIRVAGITLVGGEDRAAPELSAGRRGNRGVLRAEVRERLTDVH